MNCVETADNWMNTFDKENINYMGTIETQRLPAFVEYTATKSYDSFNMPLVNGDIMEGYHAGVFNSLTNFPIMSKLPAFKIPRGGFDAASKHHPRQERKTPLSEEKIYANVMKNRQNAAKNRLLKEKITNGLKETVLALQKNFIESQKMLTQVSLSLHSEMKISADLRSEVKRLTL